MESFRSLLVKNRSFRRFDEKTGVPVEVLRKLVELTRYAPSGGNFQPTKFIISNDRRTNGIIFDALGWAKNLPDWDGPAEGERPSAYIIVLTDKNIPAPMGLDVAIAAHTILLGAAEKGYQGCMLGSIKREVLREKLKIGENLEIRLVCAIGRGAEEVVLEDFEPGGDIVYYRDENDAQRVPKRKVEEILIKEYSAR